MFIMNAVVADMGKIEAIVDLDFLEYHQSVIDTKQHTLDLKGLVCPIPLHKQEMMLPPTKIISVTFENDLYIPGSSQLEVVAKLTGGTSTQTMLIEGQNVSHRPSVLVATAVVQLNTENTHPVVSVRLLYLAPDGVTIYKGTKLDEASIINESDSVLVDEVQEDFHDNVNQEGVAMCQRLRDSFCGKWWNPQQKTLPMNNVSSFLKCYWSMLMFLQLTPVILAIQFSWSIT